MATNTTTPAAGRFGVETASLTGLHYLGIALAAVTGVVHLVLGIQFLPTPLAISFVLAGAGFFGAIVLLLFNVRRRLLYAVGIPFTLVQVVAYFLVNPTPINAFGLFDKVVQLALVGVLIVLYRAERAEN